MDSQETIQTKEKKLTLRRTIKKLDVCQLSSAAGNNKWQVSTATKERKLTLRRTIKQKLDSAPAIKRSCE
jgi:hypothetical protein